MRSSVLQYNGTGGDFYWNVYFIYIMSRCIPLPLHFPVYILPVILLVLGS